MCSYLNADFSVRVAGKFLVFSYPIKEWYSTQPPKKLLESVRVSCPLSLLSRNTILALFEPCFCCLCLLIV